MCANISSNSSCCSPVNFYFSGLLTKTYFHNQPRLHEAQDRSGNPSPLAKGEEDAVNYFSNGPNPVWSIWTTSFLRLVALQSAYLLLRRDDHRDVCCRGPLP